MRGSRKYVTAGVPVETLKLFERIDDQLNDEEAEYP